MSTTLKLPNVEFTAVDKSAALLYSPPAGTSAQQLDASFSTNASLEFFELDLADPSLDMKSCGSFSSTHRYEENFWF